MSLPGKASLKILHVIASMSAEAGGPPVVCAGLAGALAARGHQVMIASLSEPGLTPIAVPPEVELALFPRQGITRYAVSKPLAQWLHGHLASFDVVHLHSLWQYPTFAAARGCWMWRVPYVLLLHGMLDEYSVRQHSYWLKRFYWKFREERIEGRSSGIHCLNRAEIRRAMPWIRDMPKFIVGNGISSKELARMPRKGNFRGAHPEIGDRPLAIFLSRLHPKKGLDRLIPAWKEFVERVPEGRWVIAGTGEADYIAALDRLIESSGLNNSSGKRIMRAGQLVGEKKWEALVDADIFVLPSHQEGFSMAITEALAAGCPPVVTEECNFDELNQYHCGVIILGGDMHALARSAAELVVDPARRHMLGAAGQKLVRERYTWEKIAEDVERVYHWICTNHKLPPTGEDVWRQG